MLRALKAAQAEARRAAGTAWHDHDLVFCQPDGSWWNPPAISLAFGRAVKRAGVPSIRLHDLRHTHATLLLAAGVNPRSSPSGSGTARSGSPWTPTRTSRPGCSRTAAALFMDLVYGAPAGADEAGHETMEVTS